MIKYYLIPAEITVEDGEQSRNPKYINSLKINWSGVYIESLDHYVLVTNESKDLKKFDDLKKFADVTLLEGDKKSKDKVKSKLNIDVPLDKDEVEFLAKIQVPDFTKDKIKVSD